MNNKIEAMQIEGKLYKTEAMTADTMSQFVRDVNSNKDLAAVAKHYNAVEVS